MPIQAPTLSARDLEEELRRIHARPHRTFTTAFYGAPATGLQSLTVTSGENEVIEFRVAHATCELLARRALVGAAGGPLVLLVDFDGRLPLDVTSRLAGGKVRAVTEERRLARLFGARSVSGDLLASPLKAALLADGDGGYGELPGVTLDLETAWRKYLVKMVNFPADAPLSEERLIYHCIRDLDPLGFRQVLRARSDLREALHNFLGERAGPVARLAWRAWERGVGMEVAAFVFILQAAKEALATSEYLQAWLNLRLADLDPELRNAVRGQPELLDRWGALADRLSLQFPDDAGLDEVLVVAERQLSDDRLKETLGHSRYLPSALLRGKQSLAAALGAGLAEPSLATLNEARIRLIAVEAHRLRVREPHKRQFDRARMAVRLVGYRTARTDVQAHSAVDVVAELASAYARDGGFVDWARTAARGARTDALDDAIAAVVSSLDEVRDEMDRQFAMALPEWSAHRKTVGRIVPIDQALDRFAVEFLTGGEHRRLVVLLLDGMAWANAVELLLDLEDHRWGPVRWQPKNATGDLLPPMLAALPTLTEVSRAAFFAGHLMESGERRGTGEDPDRFDGHAGLRKVLGHGPKLLLRTDTEDRPGHASRKALELVASADRVVGFVVNAIDDQLKVGPGLDVAYRFETVKALPDLLSAAAHANRAVLLVADHGHVRGDRFEIGKPATNTLSARAREVVPGDVVGEHEIVLDTDAAWRPKAKNRLAMLYREIESYGPVHHRGTHGGASLAEVVTPAILIAADDLVRSIGVEDKELDLRSFPQPTWWGLEPEKGPRPAVAPSPAPRSEKPAAKPSVQRSFPFSAPPPVPASAVVVSRLAELLRASELYREVAKKEQEFWDRRVIPVVEMLAEHEAGSMPDDMFAARIGVPKFRVPSLIAEVSQRVNIDQHPVLVHDRAQGVVRLERLLLEQLFAGEGS